MKHRRNPRFVKVKTILDSEDVKLLLSSNAINSRSVRDCVIDSSTDIRKNVDDNTSLIQKDLVTSTNRLESLIEKVLYLSIISLVISTITLCIC